MARANTVFKASRYIDHALERTEAVTAEYIARHRRHFRYRFAQVIGLLAIYAVASSSMLALGGWLIIAGELTLGQLVAAELILSVIFASLVGFGWYLDAFYETCAGLEKIAYFYRVPAEDGRGHLAPPPGPAWLTFARAGSGSHRGECVLDFEVPAGGTVMAVAESSSLQKTVIDLVQRYRTPDAGSIRFSGVDLADCDPHALRDGIAVVDSSGVLERTIFEYLAVGCPDLTQSRARDLLRTLGLESTLDSLEQGFDTPLQPFGYPLSRSEVLRLKLAAALLSRPALLVITETFDTVNRADRTRIIDYLEGQQETTVVYFSNRRDTEGFGDYLYIGSHAQQFFPTLGALVVHEEQLAAAGSEPA
jgi:putative ABC transport system ATP-binding protein